MAVKVHFSKSPGRIFLVGGEIPWPSSLLGWSPRLRKITLRGLGRSSEPVRKSQLANPVEIATASVRSSAPQKQCQVDRVKGTVACCPFGSFVGFDFATQFRCSIARVTPRCSDRSATCLRHCAPDVLPLCVCTLHTFWPPPDWASDLILYRFYETEAWEGLHSSPGDVFWFWRILAC